MTTVLSLLRPLLPVAILAPFLLVACSGEADPQPAPSASAKAKSTKAATSAKSGDQADPADDVEDGASSETIPARFRAIGTEPFWSAQVDDGMVTYTSLEVPEAQPVPATVEHSGTALILSANVDGTPLELEVTRKPCSDGMSDTSYPLAVIRRYGADTQSGCAR